MKHDDLGHSVRLTTSSARLADVIAAQALSLARFPKDRLSIEMVTYDLLAMTTFTVVLGLVDRQPDTADTLIKQLATELHTLVDEWRDAQRSEEG